MAKLDKQDRRIADIFGTQDVPEVDTETLARYLAHLKQHLALPCLLTGIEDFDWEESYVIGPGSKAEHERLRKTRPWYFEYEVDLDENIMVHMCRVSDKKKFLLPLANVETTQKKSPNYQLLDDYAVWFVNWR